MKIYMVYICIEQNIFEQMKYLFSNYKDYRYDVKSNSYYGLYGFTDSEKILCEFMSYRQPCKDMYLIKEAEMKKDQFKSMKVNCKELYIDLNEYISPDKTIYVATTFNENTESAKDGNGGENFYQFFIGHFEFSDFHPLKKDLLNSLKVLCYPTFCTINGWFCTEEEYTDENELVYGYSRTYDGRKYVNFCENEIAMFSNLFAPVIVGGNRHEGTLFYDPW